MTQLIQPRTLRGFRDYLPELMIPREQLLDTARRVYRSYGFAPIDTPALEYAEILTGKGGEESDRLIYRFTDHGGRDVALRFDLTVPFARFAAQHINQLGTPFKRYHMGPVWRGENAQHGRYREFWQCDFDIIGTTANAADLEIALVIDDLFRAIGFERFRIHLNNRLVLSGVLESFGLEGKTVPVLVALDKLHKVGRDAVAAEMSEKAGVAADQASQLLALFGARDENTELLDRLQLDFGSNEKTALGVARLRELLAAAAIAGVPSDRLTLDLTIARGLDYYTGIVFETFLTDLPGIGSVCSGGRYDNLAGLYTKQALPGVGASLGLDRLLAAMEELKLLPQATTPAAVLVTQFCSDRAGDYQHIARLLRQSGIATEVYPEPKKIGKQFEYAARRGFRLALTAGPDEFTQGVWRIKELATKEERPVAESELLSTVHSLLTTSVSETSTRDPSRTC